MTISLAQQIEEVEYELDQRAKVYPRIAGKSPGRKSELDYHVARMTAVKASLQWLAENEAAVRGYAAGRKASAA